MSRPLVHKVARFVAFVAVTKCGLYSDSVAAYREQVTCKRCRRGGK